MTITTVHASEDQSRHVGRVYQENYARLRRYCLAQLGDESEAEQCIHETMRRFFFFMEERDWEAEEEFIPVYLIRIAGLLCVRKLGEKRARRPAGTERDARGGLFDKVRAEAVETMKERIGFIKSILRPAGVEGRPPAVAANPCLK
ncbi:MAG TPA: hypothetical protein VN282_09925 [Pyrinomonadaceae bacterium]|nr:hypothetical protein [Pyrinomonadaceae bacterium]